MYANHPFYGWMRNPLGILCTRGSLTCQGNDARWDNIQPCRNFTCRARNGSVSLKIVEPLHLTRNEPIPFLLTLSLWPFSSRMRGTCINMNLSIFL